MTEKKEIDVIVQPYAGKLLIIKDLVLPEMHGDDSRRQPGSYFKRSYILQTLRRYVQIAGDITVEGDYNELVDGILCALETYIKHQLKLIIELCEHRTNFHLFTDKRCEFNRDARTTMSFLNDLERADCDSSDDSLEYYAGRSKRRRKTRHCHRNNRRYYQQQRMDYINYAAMIALGGPRKRPGSVLGNPFLHTARTSFCSLQQPRFGQQQLAVRQKHVKVNDVIELLEHDKRFKESELLYNAYLKYTK